MNANRYTTTGSAIRSRVLCHVLEVITTKSGSLVQED